MIVLKILSNSTRNGASILGDCVMLDRDGTVYPCIDNKYHPNPGTEVDEYSEIERVIDWLYQNKLSSIRPVLDRWIACRVARCLVDDPDSGLQDVLLNTLYCDNYAPDDNTVSAVQAAYQSCEDISTFNKYLTYSELDLSRKVAAFLNERFLRVRAGGKLNPEGSNSIYFRISSHDYDWRPVIEDFLWNTFRDPKSMSNYIWVGHDAETNPPEITLFEGSPEDFLDASDVKIFASDNVEWC